MTQPWIGQQMEQEKFVTSLTTRSDGWTHLQNIPLGKLLLKISVLKKVLFFESDCLYMLVGGILPGYLDYFCWVCAAGLSEPLPHYSLFCGYIVDPILIIFGEKSSFCNPNLVTFCDFCDSFLNRYIHYIPCKQRLHFRCVSWCAKSSFYQQPFKSIQKSGLIN